MYHHPQPNPARDYAEALERVTAVQARDDDNINPVSRVKLMTSGEKTQRAVVFLHGYTNSPRQFEQLGNLFFQRGWNVFIPRAPHHGLKDRMTEATRNQTGDGLLAYLAESLDIGHGLGSELHVIGFSMGGALAIWTAQYRADVTQVGVISPALSYHAIPTPLTKLAARVMLLLPNRFLWWNPIDKNRPEHSYPRYSSWGLAHIALLGQQVLEESRRAKPRAKSVQLILNPTDLAVNHTRAREIYRNWQRLGAQNLSVYEFDPKHLLMHDVIDPEQPYQKVGIVYPILMDILCNAA